MYLFKTSGKTFDSVILNQKHAFAGMPRDWYVGELVLVSKNKVDCSKNEKQIQYVMKLVDIRPLKPGESEKYWPGTEGRWRYLFICEDTRRIKQPFDLHEILGDRARLYAPIMTFKKFEPEDEELLTQYIEKVGLV